MTDAQLLDDARKFLQEFLWREFQAITLAGKRWETCPHGSVKAFFGFMEPVVDRNAEKLAEFAASCLAERDQNILNTLKAHISRLAEKDEKRLGGTATGASSDGDR